MSRSTVYVYYRVQAARIDEARRSVEQLFDAIARRGGVRGRWMRGSGHSLTFMEIYDEVDASAEFCSVLDECAAQAGMARVLEPGSARHTEVFEPA